MTEDLAAVITHSGERLSARVVRNLRQQRQQLDTKVRFKEEAGTDQVDRAAAHRYADTIPLPASAKSKATIRSAVQTASLSLELNNAPSVIAGGQQLSSLVAYLEWRLSG